MVHLNKNITSIRKTFRLKKAKELLSQYWFIKNKKGKIHSIGFCYIATEALFHLIGGEKSGYFPCYYKIKNESHWWLQNKDGHILDPTMDQYKPKKPNYKLGKRV